MGKKLYVGNLQFDVTDKDLEELFNQAGECASVAVVTDRATGQSRGFGFVEMSSNADAQKAIQQFDGQEFKGRALTVNEARDREKLQKSRHGGRARGGWTTSNLAGSTAKEATRATTGVRVDRASKETTRRTVMDMHALSTHLAAIAHPLVEAALEAEVRGAGAEAWKEEGERALRALLQDAELLRSVEPGGARVLEVLELGLENPIPADEEEIREHAAEVGNVIASAWLQLLALALRTQKEIPLDESLLPRRDAVADELWGAWEGSLNALVVGADEAATIMRTFAEKLVAGSGGLDLPGGLSLDAQRGEARYVARRR